MRDLLRETADLAADYLESVPDRPVFPHVELAAAGSEAAVGMSGGRYFGFVIGGAVPRPSRPTG